MSVDSAHHPTVNSIRPLAFAVFFAIFDVSRRVAARASSFAKRVAESVLTKATPATQMHASRIVHSTTIVTGGLFAGLAYELVCRPFDVARRSLHDTQHSIGTTLITKFREEGVLAFFRDPTRTALSSGSGYTWLRTLARLGPWGVGFLVWENFGPELL